MTEQERIDGFIKDYNAALKKWNVMTYVFVDSSLTENQFQIKVKPVEVKSSKRDKDKIK